ncbi:hypothetical protein HMPREF9332_00425 [Alloprevotella rava F0323]|uniref:DUF4124 domain-containing protein n=1 Tax=Alloprevotella rava F0323 TaxID=679199 RepID=G5GA24_9BACT|nr:hypothetical protein [Alloprevotella rava]EHG24224.1 hypothetical protein HMPREF9332_00425 [Alloprevotella rava F0323]
MKHFCFVCLLAFFVASRASSQTYTFVDEGGQLSTNPASNVLIEVLPHTAKTKVDARGYLSIGGKGQERFQCVTLTDTLKSAIQEVHVVCDRSAAAEVSLQVFLNGQQLGESQSVGYGSVAIVFQFPTQITGTLQLVFSLANSEISEKKNYQLGISSISYHTITSGVSYPQRTQSSKVFSLRGLPVFSALLVPGFYIINGRKVLIR